MNKNIKHLMFLIFGLDTVTVPIFEASTIGTYLKVHCSKITKTHFHTLVSRSVVLVCGRHTKSVLAPTEIA